MTLTTDEIAKEELEKIRLEMSPTMDPDLVEAAYSILTSEISAGESGRAKSLIKALVEERKDHDQG